MLASRPYLEIGLGVDAARGKPGRTCGAGLAVMSDGLGAASLLYRITDERWYWRHDPIGPSAKGSSEVRRLWLEVLPGEDGHP